MLNSLNNVSVISLFVLLFLAECNADYYSEWTWISGTASSNEVGNYGTQGVSVNTNRIPSRMNHAMWIDEQSIYVFGGSKQPNGLYVLNDLWVYSIQSQLWTWIKGSNQMNIGGTYGSKGTGTTTTTPGSRHSACYWKSIDGNLWLFGGSSFLNLGIWNDLWMFNKTHWTWISGNNVYNTESGVTYEMGIPSSNAPNPRYGSTAAVTASGIVFIYGGNAGYDNANKYLDELWSYNAIENTWTFHSGTLVENQWGIYQPIDFICLTPSSRQKPVIVYEDNKIWLYGGESNINNNYGFSNDLWSYSDYYWNLHTGFSNLNSTGNFTMYGEFNLKNIPGSRTGHTMWSSGNKIYVHGGTSNNIIYNDHWLFDTSLLQWTCLSGIHNITQTSIYGTLGVTSNTSNPGSLYGHTIIPINDTTSYLFGGFGYDQYSSQGSLNNLWLLVTDFQYNATSTGSTTILTTGITGTTGTGTIGTTGTTGTGTTGMSNSNDTEIYGWTWIGGGNKINVNSNYSNVNNVTVGGRVDCSLYLLDNFNLYLFGGSDDSFNYYNDLVQYDGITNTWFLISGNSIPNKVGIYGDKGIGTNNTIPGSRSRMVYWFIDNDIYLFGGRGYGSASFGYLNDVWKYNTLSFIWTWIGGTDQSNYNNNNNNNNNNIPSGRSGSFMYNINNNDIYIVGGERTNTYLLEVWKYSISTNQFTIIYSPNKQENIVGIYQKENSEYKCNRPGSRQLIKGWFRDNSIYIFGGVGFTNKQGASELNEVWSFNITNNLWKFEKLPAGRNGRYGKMGETNGDSYPGVRSRHQLWYNEYDNTAFLMGGLGTDSISSSVVCLNDLWKFNNGNWTWVSGSNTSSSIGNYGIINQTSMSNYPGCRYGHTIVKNNNFVFLFGGKGIGSTATTTGLLNDLWLFSPITSPYPPYNTTYPPSSTTTYTTTNTPTTDSITTASTITITTITSTTTNEETSSSIIDTSQSNSNSGTIIGAIIGSIGGCFLLSLLVILFIYKRRKNTKKDENQIELKDKNKVEIITISTSPSLNANQTIEEEPMPLIENVKIIKVIGEGSFGQVLLGEWNGTKIAMKKLVDINDDAILEFEQEAKLLCKLRHPSVVKFLGIYRTIIEGANTVFICMEYLKQGSLLNLLHKNKDLYSQFQLIKFMISICKGMCYLSSQKIIHLDLSCRNILVVQSDNKWICKVTDFGLAKNGVVKSESVTAEDTLNLPIRWSAPEVLADIRSATTLSDVYSMGVLIWEISEFGTLPYLGLSTKAAKEKIQQGQYLEKPKNSSEELYHLMMKCWNSIPSQRPSFNTILIELKNIKKQIKQTL